MQVTRPTSAASSASKPSPPKDSKDTQGKAGGSSPGSEAEEAGPEVPPVSTLLEFVAWVVLTGHPVGTKAVEDWSKGRGGYLMDELDRVKEASVRVQVLHPPPLLQVSRYHAVRFALKDIFCGLTCDSRLSTLEDHVWAGCPHTAHSRKSRWPCCMPVVRVCSETVNAVVGRRFGGSN